MSRRKWSEQALAPPQDNLDTVQFLHNSAQSHWLHQPAPDTFANSRTSYAQKTTSVEAQWQFQPRQGQQGSFEDSVPSSNTPTRPMAHRWQGLNEDPASFFDPCVGGCGQVPYQMADGPVIDGTGQFPFGRPGRRHVQAPENQFALGGYQPLQQEVGAQQPFPISLPSQKGMQPMMEPAGSDSSGLGEYQLSNLLGAFQQPFPAPLPCHGGMQLPLELSDSGYAGVGVYQPRDRPVAPHHPFEASLPIRVGMQMEQFSNGNFGAGGYQPPEPQPVTHQPFPVSIPGNLEMQRPMEPFGDEDLGHGQYEGFNRAGPGDFLDMNPGTILPAASFFNGNEQPFFAAGAPTGGFPPPPGHVNVMQSLMHDVNNYTWAQPVPMAPQEPRYPLRPPQKKKKKMTQQEKARMAPETLKLRQRADNNAAAARSRRKKKELQEDFIAHADRLGRHNAQLRSDNQQYRADLRQLREEAADLCRNTPDHSNYHKIQRCLSSLGNGGERETLQWPPLDVERLPRRGTVWRDVWRDLDLDGDQPHYGRLVASALSGPIRPADPASVQSTCHAPVQIPPMAASTPLGPDAGPPINQSEVTSHSVIDRTNVANGVVEDPGLEGGYQPIELPPWWNEDVVYPGAVGMVDEAPFGAAN